jgi:hypothetical protein
MDSFKIWKGNIVKNPAERCPVENKVNPKGF